MSKTSQVRKLKSAGELLAPGNISVNSLAIDEETNNTKPLNRTPSEEKISFVGANSTSGFATPKSPKERLGGHRRGASKEVSSVSRLNLEAIYSLLHSKFQVESEINRVKTHLGGLAEKRHDEDSKKGLNACIKLERSFKKMIKCLELSSSEMKEKDRNENEKNIIHFVKKVGKRATTLKQLYPAFEFDANQLEDITNVVLFNDDISYTPNTTISPTKENSLENSTKKKSIKSFMRTSASVQSSKDKVTTSGGKNRNSNTGSIHESDEISVPTFNEYSNPQETSFTPEKEVVQNKTLLQLEVKLSSINDRMLRNIIIQLASESDEMQNKITTKIEECIESSGSGSTEQNKLGVGGTGGSGGSGVKRINSVGSKSFTNIRSEFKKRAAELQKDLETVFGQSGVPPIVLDLPTPTPQQIQERLMEGYINVKQEGQKYKKRWGVVDKDKLYMFKSNEDTQQPKEVINLFCSSVRLREDKKTSHFILLTPDNKYSFYTDSEREAMQWTAILEDVTNNLIHKNIGSTSKNIKSLGNQQSNSSGGGSNSNNTNNAPNSSTNDLNNSNNDFLDMTVARKQLIEIRKEKENSKCADCDFQDPEWISINLGIFVCIECSGAHRNLGTHISKVRSILYDDVEHEHLEFLRYWGNRNSNDIYENSIPFEMEKPTPHDKLEIKHSWIRAKYRDLAFTSFRTREDIKQVVDAAVAKSKTENPLPPIIIASPTLERMADTPNTPLVKSVSDLDTPLYIAK